MECGTDKIRELLSILAKWLAIIPIPVFDHTFDHSPTVTFL